MKTFIKATFLLSLITFVSVAQVTRKTLELPEFRGIYVNSGYTVYLKQTNKQEVNVEVLSEIFAVSDIKVEDGILMINVERKDDTNKSLWAKIDDIKLNPTMNIYVSARNIDDMRVNGSGKIISENSLASNKLTLAVNGNGSLDLDVKGETINAEISGTGSLALRGYATSIDAMLSGSGNMNAFNCPIETAKIKVTGTGLCEVNVVNTIDALVYGSGRIKHKGNTKSAQKKIYGSGVIERTY
jgi:hypothetical protein